MKLQIKGVKGGKDRRGLISLTFKFLFTDSSIAEALHGELPLPFDVGLPLVNRQFVEWIDNFSFMVDGTFEGITNEPRPDEDQFAIAGEWREEPIEAFPDKKSLADKYGAYEEDGRIKFPQYLESGNSQGTGVSRSVEKETFNPLFGMANYPVMHLTATHSYVRATVPSSVYTRVGDLVKSLPGGFSNPPKRTWVIDPPQVRKRGNAWEIAEKYREVDSMKHIEVLATLMRKFKK